MNSAITHAPMGIAGSSAIGALGWRDKVNSSRARVLWLSLLMGLQLMRAGWLWASSPTETGVPRRGGTLRLACEWDINTLDPLLDYAYTEGTLQCLVFDSLLDYDREGRHVPALAEALPEVSPDRMSYRFRLRPGIRFSNGRELEAKDVVYTLERYLDPKTGQSFSPWLSKVRGTTAFKRARGEELAAPSRTTNGPSARWIEPIHVEGFRAIDRRTLQIDLEGLDFMLLEFFSSPLSAIVPAEEVERQDVFFGTHPVGTGPFVVREWTPGIRVRLVRNPDYFIPERPYLDAVDVQLNVPASTQAMMFERGEIDVQSNFMPPDFLRFRRDPHFASLVERIPGTITTYISLNCELPPFTNKLVRQALNYAINKSAIIEKLQHRAVQARGLVAPNVRGFNSHLPEYRYDPARARELLGEAGYPQGFSTALWVSRDIPTWMTIAQCVQHDLRAVGVRAELKEVSSAVAVTAIHQRRTVPMGVSDWGSAIDPKEVLEPMVNGENINDVWCMNTAFYANPATYPLFRTADQQTTMAERLEIYQKIEAIVVNDAPWIFICYLDTELIHQSWLKGIWPRGIWPPVRVEATWIER